MTALLQLYLVRHGETAWSLTGQHTGRTDLELTVHGEAQARMLAPQMHDITFSAVFTSPLKRARQTCELAGLSASSRIEPDLAERNYGDYEGLRTADILREQTDWNLFRDGCPQGEMPAQVSDRADRLIARLRGLEGNVALFSHGQFGGVLAARWIGLPLTAAQHFPLSTASLSIFGYALHHAEMPVIALWNAVPREISGPLNEPQEPTGASNEQ